MAIQYILEKASLSPTDNISIAIAGQLQHIENPLMIYLQEASKPRKLLGFFARICASIEGALNINLLKNVYFNRKAYHQYLKDEFTAIGFNPNLLNYQLYDHHLCHAATAYFPSESSHALIFTQDGRGDLLSGSVYLGAGNELTCMYTQNSGDSLAQLYAGVTKYLGFRPLRHEGKITGLAAFGKSTELKDQIIQLFSIEENGMINKTRIQQQNGSLSQVSTSQKKILKASPEEYTDFNEFGLSFQQWLKQHGANYTREDVAFAIQAATEEVMLKSIAKTLQVAKVEQPVDIGLAGGLFANVKLNQRIRGLGSEVNNVFVQPAMGDGGLSLGAAILRYQELSVRRLEPMVQPPYLGNWYTNEEIKLALDKWSNPIEFQFHEEVELEIARLIHEGKIIGRFNGKMEFGPRALGNRSILLHPSDDRLNGIVNKRLKRTEFMPFAPSVIDFRAKDYFIGYDPKHLTADWMTITYDVFRKKQKEIEAVVHVDGTARPQVVKETFNPSYYKILKEYNRLSGIGCIVNTSFNMHEEPIVASPEDALRAFDQGSVDILAIGNYLVQRKKA